MLYFWLILTCIGGIALDQIVKALVVANIPLGTDVAVIPGLIHLTYLQNSGAAFSMLEGKRVFFLILTVVFLAVVVYCVIKKIITGPYLWFATLITSGAIGNMIDRALHGYVVDMFEFEFIHFAVFNVADILITCTALVVVVYVLFFDRKDSKKC